MIAAGQRLLGRSSGGLLRQQRQFAVIAAADDGMFFLFSPGDRIKKYVVEIMYFQDDR